MGDELDGFPRPPRYDVLVPRETKRMVPEEIRRKRDALAGTPCQVNWCDDQGLDDENMDGSVLAET